MTPEQTKEYEEYCDMFATAGWKRYIEGMTEHKEITLNAAPDNAIVNDTWQYCRGMLSHMQSVIGFENYVHMVHDQQVEEESFEHEEDV